MTSPTYTLPNYEITSVAERNRLLVSVEADELPHGQPTVVGSDLERGCLILSCKHADAPYTLIFPDVPALDAARLKTFQPTLCGLAGKGVVFATAFPSPRPAASAGVKPR